MKNSHRPHNDYQNDTSREFNASTRSLAQKRNNLSSSKVNENKSKFQHRIQKACPTNSAEAYKKQVALLKKQLQRLEKQNLKKDHRIFQMESNYTMFSQLQSELEETYRIIYMYEGKIQELQKQLKRLQHRISDKIEANFTPQQIQTLLNEYQEDNTEMRSTIEGQNRIIMEMEQRLKTIQSKYFQTSWKLSSQNRVMANPLKKKFPKLRDTIVIQQISLSQREKMMNDLESKYNNLTAQKSKENTNVKVSAFSRQKMSVNKSQNQQVKNSRFSGSWQTPVSPKIAKTLTSQRQSGSQNYTVQKIQSSPKVYGNEYRQEWETNKQGNKVSYESYRANENRKSQLSLSENPSVSLNYSLSQGPNVSQRSVSPQKVVTTYLLSSSQAGQSGNYGYSQNNSNFSISQGGYNLSQNNGGSQTRIVSNSKITSGNGTTTIGNPQTTIYRNNQTSAKLNIYQGQSPQSHSNRIIRVSRDKVQPSYSQNKQSITTYYQGSSSMASGSGESTENKKIRYIMRQGS